MKKTIPILIAILFVFSLVQSCKLDPPILPGDKGYVQQYPPGSGPTGSSGTTGTTGSTGSTGSTINDAALTGKWTVTTSYIGQYYNGQAHFSLAAPVNPINDVTLNDATKTAAFDGFNTIYFTDSVQTYTVAKSGNNEYITFSEDPLDRSSNDKIQITGLTSTSMTWIGIDPKVITVSGSPSIQVVYKIVFSK
jgi:hypothetical protein